MNQMSAVILAALLAGLLLMGCGDRDQSDPNRRATEQELWERAEQARNLEAYEAYISNYPGAAHAQEAKEILRELWDRRVKELTSAQLGAATAVITTSEGTIKFKFYPPEAPNTTRNFIKLAKSHFYDGLTFHRVIRSYLIQGGDPLGTGFGGPGYTIPAELSGRPHLEGSVAMARSPNDLNSAGSQFYICLAHQPALDEKWTIFGQVIEGMDVVKNIGEVAVDGDYKPLSPVIIQSVTIEGL